ncbi:LPS export ABC transporter permease LptG [Melaminivora sp.]|uniref:LPS export ABC transporter permease LptG n=1 Tax=Melaminivora sp. TaxID=1933032 RepID=UPI0028AD456A|nr:LPS export ABC transporter permease LptG [Melaminivora sp.]
MRTIRRFIYREIATSVGFVTLAFLALFFFFDLVDELRWVGGGYQVMHAVIYVALNLPRHLYELLPITVLIGTIFVMARLAQSSEFTILRTSGLGPWRTLATLLLLGAACTVLTFVLGDYVTPATERAAQVFNAREIGQISTGATGAWLKERTDGHSRAINVRALGTDGRMRGIRVFEFDVQGRVTATLSAESGDFDEARQAWQLQQVQRSLFERPAAGGAVRLERLADDRLDWPTRITSGMVAAAVLKPDKMATIDLFRFIRHLQANGQSAQRYEIEFWRKVFYPLSCLVMVVLALPFAYLHFRSGGIAGYVFGGVMAGISFFLLNNLFGFAGNLQQWSPWLTAAAPGLIYMALSLAAFLWLVLRR